MSIRSRPAAVAAGLCLLVAATAACTSGTDRLTVGPGTPSAAVVAADGSTPAPVPTTTAVTDPTGTTPPAKRSPTAGTATPAGRATTRPARSPRSTKVRTASRSPRPTATTRAVSPWALAWNDDVELTAIHLPEGGDTRSGDVVKALAQQGCPGPQDAVLKMLVDDWTQTTVSRVSWTTDTPVRLSEDTRVDDIVTGYGTSGVYKGYLGPIPRDPANAAGGHIRLTVHYWRRNGPGTQTLSATLRLLPCPAA